MPQVKKRMLLLMLMFAVIFVVLFFYNFSLSWNISKETNLRRSENQLYQAILGDKSGPEIKDIVSENPNLMNYVFSGKTVMDISIRDDRLDVIKILIEHGFSVNDNQAGVHPLRSCMHYDRYEIAKYLLDQGSDPRLGHPSAIELADRRDNAKYLALFESYISAEDEKGSGVVSE